MGHNHTPRSIQRARDREEERERRLAGWRWDGARLEPMGTADGVLARGGVMQGACKTDECRRRVRMDLHAWVRHGFGGVSVSLLAETYRCGRIGCQMRFDPEFYPDGVPIQSYVASENRLHLKCRKCGVGKIYTAEAVIAALQRSGTGDGNTGINDLARRIRGRCKACGYPGWIADLVRPPAKGTPEHAALLRAKGEG